MSPVLRFFVVLTALASIALPARADIVHQRSVNAKVAVDAQTGAVAAAEKAARAAKKDAWDAAIKLLTPKEPPPTVDAPQQEALKSDLEARDLDKLKVHTDKVAELKAEGFVETAETAQFCGPTAAEKLPECQKTVADAYAALSTALAEADEPVTAAKAELDKRAQALNELLEYEAEASRVRPGTGFRDAVAGARRVRCFTAYCWGGDGTRYGIEPILDLPIGISWASGNGGLANYINSNRVDISVSAGLRYWFAYDTMSIGILLARPSLGNSSNIEIEQSDVVFTSAAVSRPFPTVVFGFAGDIFSITLSYDQLRNTDGAKAADPKFLPNEVLSRTFVVGLSINPFTAARNAIGAAKSASGELEKAP